MCEARAGLGDEVERLVREDVHQREHARESEHRGWRQVLDELLEQGEGGV